MTDVDWRQRAACRNSELHPDTWFPTPGDNVSRALALKVCRACPVIRDCAIYALRTQPAHGVWGGMTSRQLSVLIGVPAAMRQHTPNRALKPCGTAAAYKRHLAHGEKPCEPCLQANRRTNSENRVCRRCWTIHRHGQQECR